MNEQLFLVISLYTLCDLGDSSNLIGSLSRTMMLYSLRQAVNTLKAEQNLCRELGVLAKFQSKNFLKMQEQASVSEVLMHMILKVRKDFMLCNQRHTTTEETRPLCHCFVNPGFPRKADFAYKQNLMYEEKRKKTNIFEICTCQQINKAKNTADKQLTSIVAAVDNICRKRQQKKRLSHSRRVGRNK